MFLAIVLMCGYLLWAQAPSLKTAALVCVLVWSSSRFYYFLFYVLERYVDPTLRYAGILALMQAILRKSKKDDRGA